MNGERCMRIVLLQSCGFDHLLAARQAVVSRYPHATFVGLVKEQELLRARESGAFDEVRPLPSDIGRHVSEDILGGPVDICVVPFEDRLGIRYWQFRRFPMRHGIPIVFSYNRCGRLQEWGRVSWAMNSVLMCVAVRVIHAPMLWAWLRLRRWVDVAAAFGLAVIALGLCGLQFLGLNPLSRNLSARLPTGRQRVVLFIASLGVGGAQRQLVSCLKHLDRSRWDPELVMLDRLDKFFEPAVRELGVQITYLNRHQDFEMVQIIWWMVRHLRSRPCHVLHSWLHYTAALGAIAGRLAGIPVIIGSLRSERPSRFPWFYAKWQRPLDILTAPLHTTIIANSNAVKKENRRWAFIPDRKFLTIYNGIDVDETNLPSKACQQQLRSDLKLPADAPLIGIVGRLSREKDHATFLAAAVLISRARPESWFLIVGGGSLRQWIESEIEKLGLAGKVLLLGERKDVLALIQLLNVLVLTSTSEGFPNVLLEAAVVGTPIVTTAAGGASEIVLNGETGFVVPCGDAGAVAGRVLDMLGDSALSRRFAEAARNRMLACFSADRMALANHACYDRDLKKHLDGQVAERPLRACFISPYAYGVLRPSSGLPVGGAEVQVCSLARELARDPRFDIYVLTSDGGRTGEEPADSFTIVLSDLLWNKRGSQNASLLGASASIQQTLSGHLHIWMNRRPWRVSATLRGLVRLAYSCRERVPPLRWLVRRGRECWACVKWVRKLRSIGADVYVMRCASPQVGYVKLACAVLRRKLVYMIAHEDEISGQYVRSHGIWGKRFEWGLRRADVVVCQHSDQLGLLQVRYRREGRVIRSLCPTPVSRIEGASRKTILWIARLDEWKQPELFIKLAGRMPDESFVMVGPPSETDPVDLSSLQPGLSGLHNLRWLTQVPFADTVTLFEEAKLFINTSRAEGFPNTFLQAAACGTPIVSWAVNPERILDRYQIGYCADRDWDRFEAYIRLLCGNTSLRERMGENGRRYVHAHHDPAAVAAEYADLFFSLRDGRAPAAQGMCPEPASEGVRDPVTEVLRGR